MKKTLRVCVMAEDIAQGQPRDLQECPIARALRRAGLFDRVEVDACLLRAGPLAWWPSRDIVRFINRFDAKKSVAPFEFTLPLE
jgi:hypothetical protein